jgi:hypothetical protein
MKPFFHEVIPFVYSITAWFGRDPPRNFPWPTREKSHPHQPMWSPSSPKISVEKSHGSAQHRASPPAGVSLSRLVQIDVDLQNMK